MYYLRSIVASSCLSLLLVAHIMYGAVVISTVEIPFGPTFFNMATGALTCASTITGAKENALMRSCSAGMELTPAAPQQVTLNDVAKSLNPLYDKQITHLSGMISPDTFGRPGVERLVAVTAQEPAALIMVDTAAQQNGTFVRSIDSLNDAHGKKTAGIVCLEGTQGTTNGVFAAVQPSQGVFGNPGSGIALVSFGSTEVEKDKKKTIEWHFDQVNLGHEKNLVTSCPIDVTTKAAAIGNNLSHVGQPVALHWNGTLNRLFVGLTVTAGDDHNDGACALLVGTLPMHTCTNQEKTSLHKHRYLELEPCAPHNTVVDTSSAIIATRGARSQAAVHQITTFKTSTDLWYIAVVGGCGDPALSKNMVWAMPLNVDETEAGTLATIEQEPVTFFGPKEYPTFRARLLRDRINKPDQLALCQNRAICVGGGPLSAGPIEKIITVHDALFAVVAGEQPNAGVYHSQALINEKGLIKGWTTWRHVWRSDDKLLQAAFYDILGGSFTLLSRALDKDKEKTTFKKTVWGAGHQETRAGLVSFLRNTYTKDNSGIRAYADIPVGSPGFPDQSCMIVGGHQAMTIVIMAERDESGIMRCTHGDAFKDKMLHCTAGPLAPLGTIEAITSAATDTDAWLFVGGTGGLAVYTNNDGSGWDPHEKLHLDDMRKKICLPMGSYTFVRRLVVDAQYLYVLTDDKLDRIDLTRSTFAPKNMHLEKTTLASRALFPQLNPFGFFTDVIISNKVAFLATSRGLYRVGDGADIRHACCPDDVGWTKVDNTDGDPIVHLGAQSATGQETDVARYGGGNLYVIQGHAGRNHGSVKRFSVRDCTDKTVDDAVIAIIPDIRIENAPKMFRRIGSFSPRCVTDGSLWLYIRREPHHVSSLLTMTDLYPMHDTHLLLHHTQESNFAFAQRFESSDGAWWALGQSVVVNE